MRLSIGSIDFMTAIVLLATLTFATSAQGQRVNDGVQVLYGFSMGSGAIVADVSGVGTPLNLTIADTNQVSWIPGGGLSVDGETIISSAGAATKVTDAVQASNAITVEAWINPANATQFSPARIVTISVDANNRNVTLGQGGSSFPGDYYDVRLRTTTTNNNGTPSTSTPAGSLTADLTHVVYTRDTGGNVTIYLNGTSSATGNVGGDMTNWDDSYQFALANELTEDRAWLGEFYLVAVFDQALSGAEVLQNYAAGPFLTPSAPFIVQHPQDQSVIEGHTATFNVVAAGTPPLTFQWQRDGGDISGANETTYTTDPTTLSDDGAQFRCVVTNGEGSATSNYATLYVNEASLFTRIMPLGNSITYDNHSNDNRPDSERIAYRYPLWQMLTDMGYLFEFVGSLYQGWAYIPDPQDCHHEGHPGWTDSQIRDNIIGWLNSTPADVVLLHIGTNGLSADETQVEEILDNIDIWEAANHPVWVVLARIINRSSDSSLPEPDYIGTSALTTTFNNNVQAMAEARVGDQVIVVDIEHGEWIDYRRQPSGDMWQSPDTLHPNDYGYSKMANGWLKILQDYILPPSPLTCPANMAHYWRMEKSIPPYMDPQGFNIMYAPIAPTQVPGRVNMAQEFYGAEEAHIPDFDSFDWEPDDSFSLEFWMKKDDPVGGSDVQNNEVILGRDDATSSLHWWIGVCATCSPQGAAAFQLRDKANNGDAIYSSTDIDDGQWHHIVAVRHGPSDSNRLYVDGFLEASAEIDYPLGFDAEDIPINVGWLNLPQYYHYDGIVDEIAIYDKALDDNEVLEHYSNGLVGLGYCSGGEVEPDIYSSPVTEARVGQLYEYDVHAIGNPAPTYSLVTSPAGMTIDGTTGLIQWIPPDTTDVPVTVEASNSVGSDFQSFTIVVEQPPDCPPEMISYWPLDETSGTTYEDFYDDNDGEASPTPPTSSIDAVVGGSQSFNGTNNWIDVPDANNDFDWTATSSFSIELWAKFTNVSTRNKVMIGRDQGGGDPHWWLGAQQGSGLTMFNLLDTNSNGVACTGFTAINNNQWHHIVAVRDESLNQNRIYVDGVLEDTQTHNYSAGFAATTPLGIGYMAYNYNPDYFYEGLLDEIALYNRALSAAEIGEHYTSGLAGQGYCTMEPEAPQIVSVPVTTAVVGRPYSYDVNATGYPTPTFDLTTAPAGMTIGTFSGLIEWTPPDTGTVAVTVVATNSEGSNSQSFNIHVAAAPDCPVDMTAYWQLNETSGNSYEDIYDGHDGSAPVSVPTPATDGVVEGCQDFNGTSDYVNVPDHADFDWAANANFSIEVWAKFTNVASRNKVMIGRDQGGGSPHWWLGAQQNTGQAVFNLLDSGNNGVACFGTTIINDDEWHHIVAVRDESLNQNRLYVDGGLEDTSNHDYTASFAATTPLGIGFMAYNYNPDYYYDGKLDEIALYDRVLTSTEILEHYTNGLAGQGYCNLQPEAPVIVSSPVTEAYVALLYQYDVDATGYPQPTYGLTDNPPGMTIDSITGLIEWTPIDAPDTVNVTVEATNDAGTDNQTYSLFVYESPPCPPEMISYWRLDETAGPPYADIHGGHAASGANYPTATDGILGGAQWFNGTDDELDVSSSGHYNWGGMESFSIELWMKTTASTSGNRVIVGRDDTVNLLHWWVGAHNDGQAHFGLKDTAGDYQGLTGTSTVNDGDWHLVVAVRDASVDSNFIYVDGVKENSLSYDYTGDFSGTAPLNIGYLNLSGHYRYEGNVDEIAIYDRALSSSEVQNHFNAGTGREYCDPLAPEFTSLPSTSGMVGVPYSYDAETTGIPTPTYTLTDNPAGMTIDSVTGVISWTPPDNSDATVTIQASNSAGAADQSFTISVADAPVCPAQLSHYWPLDETTGPPYEDVWGGNDADCSLCPGSTTGRVGTALWFDGTNQVDAPDANTLDWAADASFTMAYWMQTGESTSGNRVILGRDDAGTSLHWWTGPNDDTTASFQLRDTAGNGIYLTGQGPALNDNAWHFVVCVRDDSQDSNFVYVDGTQVNSGYHDYTAGFGSGVSLNIGYINLGGLYRYHGAIDEIAIYDRAVPPEEIKQQYDNGRASHGYCDVFVPVFVSSPVVSAFYGDPYTYDCDAAGNPVPTYALTAGPDGMTIDPVTGLIEWTPTSVRPADVTVTATNSEGTAEHQFTISVDGPADVDEIPQHHFLAANHPNPFNPMTNIRFGLPRASQVEIAIFDITGRRVTTLASEPFPAGVHEVTWTGRNNRGEAQASGIYFYRLRAETFTQTRKMTLLK